MTKITLPYPVTPPHQPSPDYIKGLSDAELKIKEHNNALTARCEAAEGLLGELVTGSDRKGRDHYTCFFCAETFPKSHPYDPKHCTNPDCPAVQARAFLANATVAKSATVHPDTARLEWLEKHIRAGFASDPHITVFYGYDSEHLIGFMIIDSDNSTATRRKVITGGHDTFRAAIDAAMEAGL